MVEGVATGDMDRRKECRWGGERDGAGVKPKERGGGTEGRRGERRGRRGGRRRGGGRGGRRGMGVEGSKNV